MSEVSHSLNGHKIFRYGPNDPWLAQFNFDDNAYEISVQSMAESSHKWFLEVMSDHMGLLHARAVVKTTKNLQVAFKTLMNIP